MAITISSYISSAVSIVILSSVLFLILKKETIMSHFGLGCIYFLVLLLLLRGFIPVEFYKIHLTRTIYSQKIIPFIKDILEKNIIDLEYFSITWMKVLIFIYGIGVVIHLYKNIRGYYTTEKNIKAISEIKDLKIIEKKQRAYKKIFGRDVNRVRIACSDKFRTPAIWGLFKPTIILPLYDYLEKDYYYIFFHELMHYKHKDFLIKFLLDILVAFYWWIPFISKFLFRVVNQVQELLVDYHLTKVMDRNEKIEYMTVLTKTLRFQKNTECNLQNKEIIYALVDGHSSGNIMQRLRYIMKNSVKKISVFGILICTCLFLISFLVVFEPYYHVEIDEDGNKVYENIEGQTYYIKNGDKYDLYMEKEYVGTYDIIFETFKDIPIYRTYEEVVENEN